MRLYRLFVPKQAVGANLVYFDFFNASASTCNVDLMSCVPMVSGAVAVVGTLGVDLILTRTTAVGTGGTAATYEGTDPTAMTISAMNCKQNCNAELSARLTPSGGATAGAVLSWGCVFTEETSNATYQVFADLAVPVGLDGCPPIRINPGTGFRVVQGAVASVGNIGFNVIFKVTPQN